MNDNIKSLLASLTYDNWFTMLAVLSDAFRETGNDAYADRCNDLRIMRKRPCMSLNVDGTFSFFWGSHSDEYPTISMGQPNIPRSLSVYMYRASGCCITDSIQPLLISYLYVPEELRIRDNGE